MAIISKSLKVKMTLALVGCSMLSCSEKSSESSVVRGLMLIKRDGMDAATGSRQGPIVFLDNITKSLRGQPSGPSKSDSPTSVSVTDLECDQASNPLCRSGEDMRNAIVEEANFRAKLKGSSVAEDALTDPEVISFADGFWNKRSYSANELRQEADRIEQRAVDFINSPLRGLEEEYAELARQVVEEEAEEMELVAEDENEKRAIQGNDSEFNTEGEISASTHTDVLAAMEKILAKKAEDEEAAKQKTLADNARFAEELNEANAALKQEQQAALKAEFEAKQAAEIQRALDQAAFEYQPVIVNMTECTTSPSSSFVELNPDFKGFSQSTKLAGFESVGSSMVRGFVMGVGHLPRTFTVRLDRKVDSFLNAHGHKIPVNDEYSQLLTFSHEDLHTQDIVSLPDLKKERFYMTRAPPLELMRVNQDSLSNLENNFTKGAAFSGAMNLVTGEIFLVGLKSSGEYGAGAPKAKQGVLGSSWTAIEHKGLSQISGKEDTSHIQLVELIQQARPEEESSSYCGFTVQLGPSRFDEKESWPATRAQVRSMSRSLNSFELDRQEGVLEPQLLKAITEKLRPVFEQKNWNLVSGEERRGFPTVAHDQTAPQKKMQMQLVSELREKTKNTLLQRPY